MPKPSENSSLVFPSASLPRLKTRARMLALIRGFMDAHGYWEVDTPILSADRTVDPHLEAFVVRGERDDRAKSSPPPFYLQASPEFGMKRLLAAGADAIYQLGKVFRAGERGGRHNPEFTMLEWYRVGDGPIEQMDFTERLVVETVAALRAGEPFSGPLPPCPAPFQRTTYREAFERRLGVNPHVAAPETLADLARAEQLTIPAGMERASRDDWLNLLLAECLEPGLGRDRPEFLYNYPPTQAAIARIRPGDEAVAERFELYWRGIELCNGYHELTDVDELRRRIAEESLRRTADGLSPLPSSNRLLEAMEHGLPPSTGVALGFDRLLMLAVNARAIDEVLAFPIERA